MKEPLFIGTNIMAVNEEDAVYVCVPLWYSPKHKVEWIFNLSRRTSEPLFRKGGTRLYFYAPSFPWELYLRSHSLL